MQHGEKRDKKYLFWEADGTNTMGSMDGMWLPHGQLENRGDNQSNAMAAGGFSEEKTGGFGPFMCLCMGRGSVPTHPHPCTSPNTSPSREQRDTAALHSVSCPW